MSIPVIQLDDVDRNGLVTALRFACVEVGFFYLEGHGISEDLMKRVIRQSELLFDLPLDEKCALSDKVMSRGYTAMEEETLDPKCQRKGDTKEGFYLAKDVPKDSPQFNPAKLMGPNQWPSSEKTPSMVDCEAFRDTMNEYWEECRRVGFRMQQLLALAIGLDEHHFDDAFADPICTLRLLHYSIEESKPQDGIFGCGAHSDYDLITMLLTDDNPGLQILTKEGTWIDVPPRPSSFIVNLGDMLERWTNGLFRSTRHRVLIRGGNSERYSIPCFYDPHFDTEVKVLDICCSPDNPPKYPVTTAGQHLVDKYKQTHADFEPEK